MDPIRQNMRIKYFIFAIILLVVQCSSKDENIEDKQPPPEEEVVVKVMTYNIWGARSGGIPDLAPIANVIKRHDPDLVSLQEVDKNTRRNAKLGDIAKKLGELTGMERYFVKAMDHDGGEYGDAVLSKLPIKERKGYNLGVTPELGGEPRSVARVTVEKENKEFYFIATHFDHLGNEANRLKQARDLVDILKSYDKRVIVAGDLNATPESETIRILQEHLVSGCMNNNCTQYTFSTSNPNRIIDYIMYAPVEAMTVKSYFVDTKAYQESDHFPVIATIKIN